MTDVEIRPACPSRAYNRKKGRSCTEDDLCTICSMDRHVEENSELYAAMGNI